MMDVIIVGSSSTMEITSSSSASIISGRESRTAPRIPLMISGIAATSSEIIWGSACTMPRTICVTALMIFGIAPTINCTMPVIISGRADSSSGSACRIPSASAVIMASAASKSGSRFAMNDCAICGIAETNVEIRFGIPSEIPSASDEITCIPESMISGRSSKICGTKSRIRGGITSRSGRSVSGMVCTAVATTVIAASISPGIRSFTIPGNSSTILGAISDTRRATPFNAVSMRGTTLCAAVSRLSTKLSTSTPKFCESSEMPVSRFCQADFIEATDP